MTKPINASSEPSVMMPVKKKPASFWQNVFVGSAAGISAVSVIQPMMFFKNINQAIALQNEHEKLISKAMMKNPRCWYRGVGGFATSFAPTTAIQTATKGFFSQKLDSVTAATLAGICSAVIVCPFEGIMIQQQKTGERFKTIVKHTLSRGPLSFFRGFVPTAIREGAFSGAYQGVAPLVKEKIKSYGFHEGFSQVAAGIFVGTIAAAVSHPFDTFKTKKQRDISMKTPMIKALFQKEAFAGFGWRTAMVATAVTVIPLVQEKINTKIEKLRN